MPSTPMFYAPDAGDGGGGTPAGTPAPEGTPSGTPPGTPAPNDDQLGDAGIAALRAERQARTAAENALKKLRGEFDGLKKATQTEQEKAIEAARGEGRTEALTTSNVRLVRAEVKAAAAGKAIDPDAVVALLDLDQFKVSDSGDVNQKEISSAIDELLKDKPYLAAGNGKRPADLKQGARGATTELDPNQFLRDMARR